MQWKPIFGIPFILKSHNNTDATDQNAYFKLEMWANTNVMAALPNIGGALCSTPQFG